MASRVTQFRYYAEKNANNYPADLTWPGYCTQATFKKFSPIMQLGIQTLPGTKIYLNSSLEPIVIGSSGVFELDVTGTTAVITGLRVEQNSMEQIRDLPNGYIIIDMVYGDQGEANA